MALNVPIAMLMSMVVAFTITPWLSYHVLKGEYGKEAEPFVLERSLTFRIYSTIVSPFVNRRLWAWLLLLVVAVLFVLSSLLAATGRVPLKMLPFDNKAEFQVVVDMPEGTTVETTDEVLRALADRLREAPEVTEVLTFAGTSSPIDFNGMVRHYYLRSGANVGDIRVNLLAQGRARAAKPRDPAAFAERIAGHRESLRRQHETRRGSAGATGDRHADGGSLRPHRSVL